MAITGKCVSAHHEGPREIPSDLLAYEISGFEVERDAGGTNHVLNRKRTGVVWCVTCVEIEKFGGAPQVLDFGEGDGS